MTYESMYCVQVSLASLKAASTAATWNLSHETSGVGAAKATDESAMSEMKRSVDSILKE